MSDEKSLLERIREAHKEIPKPFNQRGRIEFVIYGNARLIEKWNELLDNVIQKKPPK